MQVAWLLLMFLLMFRELMLTSFSSLLTFMYSLFPVFTAVEQVRAELYSRRHHSSIANQH